MKSKILIGFLSFLIGIIIGKLFIPRIFEPVPIEITKTLEIPYTAWEMNKDIKDSDREFRGTIKAGSVCKSDFMKSQVRFVSCHMVLPREYTKELPPE